MKIEVNDITEGKKFNKVVVALYQPRLLDSMFRQDPTTFLYHLKDDNYFFERIHNNLDFLTDKRVNVLCLPELCVSKGMIEKIESLAKGFKMVIIGGSFYEHRKALCPIITPTGIYLTEKIHASPYELLPMAGTGIVGGNTVTILKSKFGNFVVLICSDFLDSNLKNKLVQECSLDFIFVVSCNPDSQRFHAIMSADCQNNQPGLYICYTNSIGVFNADGKTAIFGVMDKYYLDMLNSSGLKPEDGIPYKICEIEDEEILIAEFDLIHKKPPITKTIETKPNIRILYPTSLPVRLFEPKRGLIIDIPTKELKGTLKDSLTLCQNSIFEIAWNYIRKQQSTMVTMEELKSYIIGKIEKVLESSFDEVVNRYSETAIPKVSGWEHLLLPTSSSPFNYHVELRKKIIEACKMLTEEFPDVPPKLNVLSYAKFEEDDDLDCIFITGHNTNKMNMDDSQLSVVRKMDSLFQYSGPIPSSETPINWEIHNRTGAEIIVHINTKEVFRFAHALLVDPKFSDICSKHPFIDYDRNKITIKKESSHLKYIQIVEKAIHVDVTELANMVSFAFAHEIFDTLVIGKRHAAWFVIDGFEGIVEKAKEFNRMVGEFTEDFFHLKNNQIICPNCRLRIRALIDQDIKGEIKCPQCSFSISVKGVRS
ncbi:MAG: hypothetical protein AB1638_06540 [Nitrospirota bacterium]